MISRALKPGGRNLIQVPNVLYARARLPQRSWIPSDGMVELVEHRWNKKDSYMEGAMIPLRFGEVLEGLDKRSNSASASTRSTSCARSTPRSA